MLCVSVIGGDQHQRASVAVAADWFAGIAMPDTGQVVVRIEIKRTTDSWGWVSKGGGSLYFMVLDPRQTLRSLLQTLMHELLHLRQYERGSWRGDGETEAASAEVLADAVWLAGLV